jgi:hypothetical protein
VKGADSTVIILKKYRKEVFMSVGTKIDSWIGKGTRALKRLKQNHLCDTCKRYITGFCGLGQEITDGKYYQEFLLLHIHERYDRIPQVTILIGSCSHYSKKRCK